MPDIWFKQPDLATLQTLTENSMLQLLSIEFTDILSDGLVARMPVDNRTKQPAGILHGGASCVLAETLGSVAAAWCIDEEKFRCVGLDINTNHIRMATAGFVTGTAKPFHLGKLTQVWGIDMVNDEKKLVAVSRLTVAVLPLV